MSSQPEPAEQDVWSHLRESMERLANLGRQKNDTEALAKRLDARANQLRSRMTTAHASEPSVMFLAYHKGNQRYGILASDVIEVQAFEQFSPVPGTPAFIAGVMHWRGNVLSLLDLGKLLGIPETGIADIHVCLIVEAAQRRVAVVALEIEEILTVPQSEVKPPPVLPVNIPPEWILGVHDENRIILRMEKILEDARFVDWRA